jgi:hypothetical protein
MFGRSRALSCRLAWMEARKPLVTENPFYTPLVSFAELGTAGRMGVALAAGARNSRVDVLPDLSGNVVQRRPNEHKIS